ncbi:hypothetical protein V2J09_017813 [Rumex salicifolius]
MTSSVAAADGSRQSGALCSIGAAGQAIQVPIAPQQQRKQQQNQQSSEFGGDDLSNYKPMSWKNKCVYRHIIDVVCRLFFTMVQSSAPFIFPWSRFSLPPVSFQQSTAVPDGVGLRWRLGARVTDSGHLRI